MPQISKVKLKDIKEAKRFDAEYFKLEYIKLKKVFLRLETKPLGYFLEDRIMTGHTPSMSNKRYYGGSIKFIKTDNVRVNYIKPVFNHYLSEEGNNLISKTALRELDIIMTIIGATEDVVGRVAIINKEILQYARRQYAKSYYKYIR